MTVLDAEELNTRLARTLDVLSGGPRDAPDRQRTLRATIDWSHRLLSAPEADAFARFAVFAGGATIGAAQAVTGGELDALHGLVDKQLLLAPSRLQPRRPPADARNRARVRPRAARRPRTTRRRHMSATAGTTWPSPSAPSPNCSPVERRDGCRGSTPRSTTSARRSTGACDTATRGWPCASSVCCPSSGKSATCRTRAWSG